MNIFIQQVIESQLEPFLGSLFGYDKIRVEGAIIHKTDFNTSSNTMSYNYRPFSLLDASITLNRHIHTNFDESINLHAYLDDLIVSVEGLIVT
jgi:hypothetical protein